MNFYGIATWYLGYLAINSFSHANFELKSEDYNRWIGRDRHEHHVPLAASLQVLGQFRIGNTRLDRLFRTEWRHYALAYDRISSAP